LAIAKQTQQTATGTARPVGTLLDVAADARASEIVDRLRRGGGRVTRSRRVVIDALVRGPGHHVTAADLVATIRADDPEFYESTVYRTLDRLLALGIIERVQLGSGSAVFHLPHVPHHHLVCRDCGAVHEIPAGLLDDLAVRLEAENGFRLLPSASTLVGLCRRCGGTAATSD
jgi:Fur family ferric uptake transcriptional regulator